MTVEAVSVCLGSDQQLSHQIAQLIEKAQLPPVRLHANYHGDQVYHNHLNVQTSETPSLANYDDLIPVQNLSELGIEPLPSPEDIRHVTQNYLLDQQQSTQIFLLYI